MKSLRKPRGRDKTGSSLRVRRVVLRALAIVVTLVGLSLPAAAASSSDAGQEDIRILKQAQANLDNTALLNELLGEIERDIRAAPNFAPHHYVRGWLLSHIGRKEEAVAAYDRAAVLDPSLSYAYYNAGVVLTDLGRIDEALVHFNAAAKEDPKIVDAWYNAAQIYYNRHEFAEALTYWQKAKALTPKDFEVSKKVLQALNALHRTAEAAKARTALIALWRNSEDADTRALTEFCFDQRDVGKIHVYAYETFEPVRNNGNLYTFFLTLPGANGDDTIGLVTLDPEHGGPEPGPPWVLDFTLGNKVQGATNYTYARLPAYELLWPDIETTIRQHFASAVN